MSNPFDILAEDTGLSDKHMAAMEFFIALKEKIAAPAVAVDKSIASQIKKDINKAKKDKQVSLKTSLITKATNSNLSVRKLPKIDKGLRKQIDTGATAIAQQDTKPKARFTGNKAQNLALAKTKLKQRLLKKPLRAQKATI